MLLASDGSMAIALAHKHKIDVAVLDIRMAGMSGIEVLERLKHVDPAIEVVMMTAFETTDTIRQALRLRATDYINKPFDIRTMRAAVATTAMQKRRTLGERGYQQQHRTVAGTAGGIAEAADRRADPPRRAATSTPASSMTSTAR